MYVGKSRWVALLDGYKSTRGDWVYCGGPLRMTEKPECERFVRPVVISPPPPFLFLFFPFLFFFRHPEVPAFFVQFDGPARA